jgi:hypothetical protein
VQSDLKATPFDTNYRARSMARIGRPPIVFLTSSNDEFRPEQPSAVRLTNGLGWSTPADALTAVRTQV